MEGVGFDEYGNPEIEGNSWEFDPHRIRNSPTVYGELITFMEDDVFPLRRSITKCAVIPLIWMLESIADRGQMTGLRIFSIGGAQYGADKL